MPRVRRNAITIISSLVAASAIAGCQYDGREGVASSAVLVAEGHTPLNYVATLDGTVFVCERSTDHVIYSGKIAKGQRVTVVPDQSQVTLDGQIVSHQHLDQAEPHRIYLEPAAGALSH